MSECVMCGLPSVQDHHVVYVQELRRVRSEAPKTALREDDRNLVPVCLGCHAQHHNRAAPFPLSILPDSVFEFAREVLGVGPAYEYLRRRYIGEDPRLMELLEACDA